MEQIIFDSSLFGAAKYRFWKSFFKNPGFFQVVYQFNYSSYSHPSFKICVSVFSVLVMCFSHGESDRYQCFEGNVQVSRNEANRVQVSRVRVPKHPKSNRSESSCSYSPSVQASRIQASRNQVSVYASRVQLFQYPFFC